MALKAYKISLSYLSELISYFSISLYPSNSPHFSYNSCLILNRDGKQRIRTFSYSITRLSQVHKGEIPHNLQMFTQISVSQWSLPYWKLQLSHTFSNPLLCFIFPFCTYHLLTFSILFLLIVIFLAPLEYKLHVTRLFGSVLTHRYSISTKN